MVRVCTVCAYPARQAIDQALIAGASYRDIARQFGVSKDATMRHRSEHLLPALVAAWQAERATDGRELVDELRGSMDALTKLVQACDAWLTDPDDPTRYDLGPRAQDVLVTYEAPQGSEWRPERRKAPLAELLTRVQGHEAVGELRLVEHKSADPRKLLIVATTALAGHLRLMGELLGKVQTQGTINILAGPEWQALRGRLLVALEPYPEAKLALAEALDPSERADTSGFTLESLGHH